MAKNIHEMKKNCILCGKEFFTTRDWKLTCSNECSKKLNKQRALERSQRLAKTPQAKRLIQNAAKLKKAVAEVAHRQRMQRQKEARELGLSYAQYIAQKGIKEI